MPELKYLLMAVITVVLGATGTYLLLPHAHGTVKPRQARSAGYAMIVVSLLLLAGFWTPMGDLLASVFFYAFGLAAIAGGVLTITSRDPVHSALWFASVVLATSGLFMISDASFLAAGTIIVYAGAIVVTFLFVIMLAQSEGQAVYDRASRAPARSTFSCFLLFWGLLYAVLMVQHPERAPLTAQEQERAAVLGLPHEKTSLTTEEKANRLVPTFAITRHQDVPAHSGVDAVLDRAIRPATGRIHPEAAHVAGLGATLFSDHLISVEIAGAILFVALVGAAAIATPRPPVRPGDRA
jgi:NADH-quinone oxidoreductase subunit J